MDVSKVCLRKVPWFPDGLAYEMNLTKDNIRNSRKSKESSYKETSYKIQ